MERVLIAALLALSVVLWGAPVAACGMLRRPMMQTEDTSRLLMVRAGALEKHGESRSALRLYERIMHDEIARKAVRSSAALAAFRIRLEMGEVDRAEQRLALALRLNENNRAALVALGKQTVEREPKVAADALRRALDLGLGRHRRGEAHALMAHAQARLGHTAAARRHLRAADSQSGPVNLIAIARLALEDDDAAATVATRRD